MNALYHVSDPVRTEVADGNVREQVVGRLRGRSEVLSDEDRNDERVDRKDTGHDDRNQGLCYRK